MVLVTILAVACTQTPSASRSPSPLTAGSIAWTDCTKGFQCGNLMVPLDYSHPTGRKISIALIRKPATGTPKVGSLLINPGAPGASAITFLRDSPIWYTNLNLHFDLFSFDPRAVAGSIPAHCV